jgi:O-antigen/teichoic acid export membrane protein
VFQKLKSLFRDLAIYGLGDVATSIVSFLLLPIYVRYLSPQDYGILALLLVVEVVAKIVFRWGLDASFMRMYYDCADDAARQRLTSTILFFLLAVNGAWLLAALAVSPLASPRLFGVSGYTLALQVTLVNSFIGGFFFFPFHVLRILGKPREFSALTFARSFSVVVLRLVMVVILGYGVLGVQLADLVVTVAFTFVLARRLAPLIRLVFSRELLNEALEFGLPRVPHGVAQQTMAVADRYLLSLFVPLGDVGLYAVGASFGVALKLFLSAFEYAWAPFYFGAMNEPNAKHLYRSATTYALAVLALATAGLSAVADDLVRLMTAPEFFGASRVVPWIAIGVTLQGVYLLTSIGLNITKHTGYYPIATALAAATSVGANLLLIPRFGMMGAAWSNVLAFGVQAAAAMRFSQRFYPMRYEWGRLARILLAAIVSYLAASQLPLFSPGALVAVIVRGSAVVLLFVSVLGVTGFLTARERSRVRDLAGQLLPSSEHRAGL